MLSYDGSSRIGIWPSLRGPRTVLSRVSHRPGGSLKRYFSDPAQPGSEGGGKRTESQGGFLALPREDVSCFEGDGDLWGEA